MKKIAAVVISLLLLMPAAAHASSFTDVPSDNWAEPAVTFLADKGVISGYSDGTFRPNKPMTRAEFIHIFHTLLPNEGQVAAKLDYGDVNGHWAADDFKAVLGLGSRVFADHYYKGVAYLAPDKQVTRWDLAMLVGSLVPAIDYSGNADLLKALAAYKDIKIRTVTASDTHSLYSPAILTWKVDGEATFSGELERMKANYVYSVIRQNVMTATKSYFRPTAKVTRAEAAMTLYRLYAKLHN